MSPRRPRRPLPAPAPAAPLVLPIPTAWARERIAAAGDPEQVPEYGSPAWHELAEDDPRKLAAVVLAAEVHRYEAATLADRLARELGAPNVAREVGDLADVIERGAREAQAREERLSEHTRRSIDGAARRLVAGRVEPYADPRPVAQAEGWPPVDFPAPAPGAEVVPVRVPTPVQMLRRLARRT